MTVTADGWKNKVGTKDRNCSCGDWKNHWIKFSSKAWPASCSVWGCNNKATLGAHVINPQVMGEHIVPMCDSCNKLGGSFSLKGGISIPSANRAQTCGQ